MLSRHPRSIFVLGTLGKLSHASSTRHHQQPGQQPMHTTQHISHNTLLETIFFVYAIGVSLLVQVILSTQIVANAGRDRRQNDKKKTIFPSDAKPYFKPSSRPTTRSHQCWRRKVSLATYQTRQEIKGRFLAQPRTYHTPPMT